MRIAGETVLYSYTKPIGQFKKNEIKSSSLRPQNTTFESRRQALKLFMNMKNMDER